MATNKNARLRYEALDKCLSNFSRRFYIEDLQKAVCAYLKAELSEDVSISTRQIYEDLREMETSPSMNAPIGKYKDGNRRKYYRYTVEGYSIVELTDEELIGLESTVNMLASFRGLPQFDWMLDIIEKLKKKYKVNRKYKVILSFDSNVDLQGIDRFKELFGYIENEQPIRVTYAPFQKPQYDKVIHPYYLKQYNNRWFLLGFSSEFNGISVYPLDRIISVEPIDTPFIPDRIIEDPDDYFFDVIGVTIPKDRFPEKVILRFSPHRYPYIVAKPIHPSQRQDDKERTVTLTLIPNRELTATILGFGNDVEVIEPESLREEIRLIVKDCANIYGLLKNGCKSRL